jgi:hypothetical protein
MPHVVSSKAMKVTVILAAEAIVDLVVPEGRPRLSLTITVDDRRYVADLAAKSVRRAIAAIREHGPDGVAVVLQGKLGANNAIQDAGISAQLKAPRQPGTEGVQAMAAA